MCFHEEHGSSVFMRQAEHTKPLRCMSCLYTLPIFSTALHYRNTNSVNQSLATTIISSQPFPQSLKKKSYFNSNEDALCFPTFYNLCELSRYFHFLDEISNIFAATIVIFQLFAVSDTHFLVCYGFLDAKGIFNLSFNSKNKICGKRVL